jgi:hypothetical protein
MTKTNMVRVMHLLSPEEQAVICRLLIDCKACKEYRNIHRGSLPFVDVDAVVRHLYCATGLHYRYAKKILSKLGKVFPGFVFTASTSGPAGVELDDAKVYRCFGSTPSRGVIIPILPKAKVTAGLKWSLGKKGYVADKDVMVNPTAALYRAEPGYWEVHADKKHMDIVLQWLKAHCT